MITKTNAEIKAFIAELDALLEGSNVQETVYDVEPSEAKAAATKAIDIAGDLLLDIAELLYRGERFVPELAQDEAISQRLKEARELFNKASRQRDLDDSKNEYAKYREINYDALINATNIDLILTDEDTLIERGYTPLKIAFHIMKGVEDMKGVLV